METDAHLDALLLQDDSVSDGESSSSSSALWPPSLLAHEEAKSDVARSPSRPDSPCSVEAPPPPPLRRTRRRNEKRRVRHRESMACYRHEERVRVDALTTQQSALHRILLQMLAHKKPIHSTSDQPRRQLQTQFTELVRTRETLEREHQQLLASVVGHTQRFAAFQIMVQRMQSIARETAAPSGVESGHWIEFLPDEPRLLYDPESPASTRAILHAGLEAIQRVHDSLSHPQRSHVIASCLGWRAEQTRALVDASTGRFRLQMRFTKRIPRSRTTLAELLSKTWDFLNSPALIARVNNAAVTAHVVQQLDDDTIVLLRNSPDAHGHKRFRYFSLNARRHESDGAVGVVMLVLDKKARLERPLRVEEKGARLPPLRWMKQGGSSLRFAIARDDARAIEIEYTGFIDSLSNEHAAHLLVANGAALLRWEHLVVPPHLLQQDQS